MVPALPRFDGVMNDLKVQQELGDLPLGDITAPTLVVGSRTTATSVNTNSVNSNATGKTFDSTVTNKTARGSQVRPWAPFKGDLFP